MQRRFLRRVDCRLETLRRGAEMSVRYVGRSDFRDETPMKSRTLEEFSTPAQVLPF